MLTAGFEAGTCSVWCSTRPCCRVSHTAKGILGDGQNCGCCCYCLSSSSSSSTCKIEVAHCNIPSTAEPATRWYRQFRTKPGLQSHPCRVTSGLQP
jgi:hypothetical protein